MPDLTQRLAFRAERSAGRWRGRDLAGTVTLFVEADEIVVRLESSGEEFPVSFAMLHGASWRGGVLWLHLAEESLQLSGGDTLDRAWHAVSQRACTLPEVARALRSLDGDIARHAAARERFFTPLLQARRRLEGDEPVDWRVASFDADALAERLRGVLSAMALERHAEQPPYRRALEASLLDACEAMFAHLARVGESARAVHDADDARRFVAWRGWTREVRSLFAHADRAWDSVRGVLSSADRERARPFR